MKVASDGKLVVSLSDIPTLDVGRDLTLKILASIDKYKWLAKHYPQSSKKGYLEYKHGGIQPEIWFNIPKNKEFIMFFRQLDYVCVCSHCKDKKIFKVMIHNKPITGWLLSEIAREDKVELTEASAMAAGIVSISHGVCDRHGVILSKAIKNWRRPSEEKLCIQCDHIKTKCTCPTFDDGYEWLEGKTD